MDIRAAEISAILKEQIAGFGTEADVAEVGQVISVGDGVARVYGLDKVQAGEMVEFQNGVFYMVDLGSTNGVEFHGQRVTRKAIAEGDVFRICDHEVVFTFR
jgi:F-type H+-transporting ATPase subunit alpha